MIIKIGILLTHTHHRKNCGLPAYRVDESGYCKSVKKPSIDVQIQLKELETTINNTTYIRQKTTTIHKTITTSTCISSSSSSSSYFTVIIILLLTYSRILLTQSFSIRSVRNSYLIGNRLSFIRQTQILQQSYHQSQRYSSVKMGDLIDGTATAATIRLELKERVKELQETLGVTPGLAVILVGERRDSATYVRSKKKACAEVGIASFGFDYPADVTEADLIAKIDELNAGKILLPGLLLVLPSDVFLYNRSQG